MVEVYSRGQKFGGGDPPEVRGGPPEVWGGYNGLMYFPTHWRKHISIYLLYHLTKDCKARENKILLILFIVTPRHTDFRGWTIWTIQHNFFLSFLTLLSVNAFWMKKYKTRKHLKVQRLLNNRPKLDWIKFVATKVATLQLCHFISDHLPNVQLNPIPAGVLENQDMLGGSILPPPP